MLRKKQVVTIVSIVVVSFLVGTSVATDGGNPFDNIWNAFYGLESRVQALEEQSLPQGFVGAPAYDSGWIGLSEGETRTLIHNMNTTRLLVYFIGCAGALPPGYNGGINQIAYGAFAWPTGNGAYWSDLEDNTIRIHRALHDARYEQVRVMIWKIQEPPT